MKWILKTKKKSSEIPGVSCCLGNKNKFKLKRRALIVALFVVFGYFTFFINQTKANTYYCTCSGNGKPDSSTQIPGSPDGSPPPQSSYDQCMSSCKASGYSQGSVSNEAPTSVKVYEGTAKATTSAFGAIGDGLKAVFQWILSQVLAACGWLFAIAATLFSWIIDPRNVSDPATGILNKQAIKDVWIMVRDLLNMTFILVLLFSAFCTIFQYDEWGLKRVWLNILINALLVNFSYPIARFVIDMSNVAFYYFVNNLFKNTGVSAVNGNSIFAALTQTSGIAQILTPINYADNPIAFLIIQIIFVFCFGMTLLIIGALFVVRLIALSMLIMFSPIGFVGYIFPSWRKAASRWWDSLFSYSFFAPIMIFMMSIALRMSQQIKETNFQSMFQKGGTNTGQDLALYISQVTFYLIPLIILWYGMGIAKSMSIAGAAQVTGKVQGWGKKIGGAVWGGAKWTAFKNPVARGLKEGVKDKTFFGKYSINRGVKWWKSDSQIEAAVKGGVVGFGQEKGWRKGMSEGWNKVSDKDVNEKMKEYKDKNKTNDDVAKDLLNEKASRTDRVAAARHLMNEKGALNDPKRLIAALELAGNNRSLRNKILDNAGDFASNDQFDATHLREVMQRATDGYEAGSQEEKDMTNKIKGAIRKENVLKLIKLEQLLQPGKSANDIYKENLDKLDAEGLAKQKKIHDRLDPTNPDHDPEFTRYVNREVANNDEFHQKVFEKMTKANRNKWATAGFAPTPPPANNRTQTQTQTP